MKMIFNAIVVSSFLLLSHVSASERNVKIFVPSEFKLSIHRMPSGSIEYYIRYHSEPMELVKTKYRALSNGKEAMTSIANTQLSDLEYEILKKKIGEALTISYAESTRIEDGELWCIESSIFQSIKACIRSPEYETSRRGYVGLVELRNYIEAKF